jgi:serine/threonine protein phosphatase PrpC
LGKFLDKLFGRLETNNEPKGFDSVDSIAEPIQIKEIVKSLPVQVEPAQFLVGVSQSIGKQRDHNEDSLFSLNHVLAGDGENIPVGIFIIADGMGGHQHGELASSVAIRVVAGRLVHRLYQPLFSLESGNHNDPLQEVMQASVQEAQQAVAKEVPGGGTTLTAVFVIGDQVTIAHVGDSRAYFVYPDGNIHTITRDHSLVRRLIELGQLTEQEAANHPQRNVLYRALGQGEPFEPDINTHQFPQQGYLLLCSDGLWGVISEAEILAIIQSSSNPSIACQRMVDSANAAGGPDNISVILVQYPE